MNRSPSFSRTIMKNRNISLFPNPSWLSLFASPLGRVLFSLFLCTPTAFSQSVPDPLLSRIDDSVRPGTDFFLYANGGWFKQHPIPASEPSNGLWHIIRAGAISAPGSVSNPMFP